MKIRLDKYKIKEDKIEVYNKSRKIYIPLISGNDKDITTLVNKGEYIYKGSIVGKTKGNFRIPIHSSVSGTVVDFVEKSCFNGEKIKCVVIENDFKENIEQNIKTEKKINTYNKEQFIKMLRENGIIGLGGAGFPTYVKYENNKIKTLIVNAVECEPFANADFALANEKCEEILETIDAILDINEIDEAIIAIKNDNVELRKLFDNFIGTYLRIKLKTVSTVYPSGWERNLIKEILGINYDKLPIEQGIIVNNISTIFSIYEALKYRKPLIERVVTFSGNAINGNKNILLKVGTPIKEVLDGLGVSDNAIIVAGGAMMGKKVDEDLVMSANISCVSVLNMNCEKPSLCIKCGACILACPSKLSPVLIMKQINKKNNDISFLQKMKPNNCVECGLCSYVCPSKLNVREEVIKAKNILKEGK